MKIFKNLFGNGSKIDASEIVRIENGAPQILDDIFTRFIY